MKTPTLRRLLFLPAAAFALAATAVPPRPAVVLTGRLDAGRILAARPDWARAVREYEPNFRAVDGLRGFAGSARVHVFFGTWDDHGQALVAALVKTLEAAANPAIDVEWTGVSENLKEPAAALRAEGVDRVPTLIVRSGGDELGRIVEAPLNSLEEDLASILLGVPFSDADMDLFRSRPHSHLPLDCTPCHVPSRRPDSR